MKTTEEYEKAVLYKLWRNRCFGRGHMLIDNLIKGYPNSDVGNVRYALDQLIQRKWVVKKPTKHGMAVYINLNYREKVMQELKKRYSFL